MVKSKEKECPPCTTCIVRASCGNQLIVDDKRATYLRVEYARRCPQIIKYLGKREDGGINLHSFDKIRKICRVFVEGKPIGLVIT